MSIAQLVQMPQVQTELKLTDDQKKQLDTYSEESRGRMREQFGRMRDMSREERQAEFTKLREQGDTLARILEDFERKYLTI